MVVLGIDYVHRWHFTQWVHIERIRLKHVIRFDSIQDCRDAGDAVRFLVPQMLNTAKAGLS